MICGGLDVNLRVRRTYASEASSFNAQVKSKRRRKIVRRWISCVVLQIVLRCIFLFVHPSFFSTVLLNWSVVRSSGGGQRWLNTIGASIFTLRNLLVESYALQLAAAAQQLRSRFQFRVRMPATELHTSRVVVGVLLACWLYLSVLFFLFPAAVLNEGQHPASLQLWRHLLVICLKTLQMKTLSVVGVKLDGSCRRC